MTLIAFAAGRGRADLITDTLTYTHTATRMGHTSKVMLLPHLDAAVMDQGSTGFAKQARFEVMNLAQRATSFDELHRWAPDALRTVWGRLAAATDAENAVHGTSASVANSVIFFVGYSPEHAAFRAYGYASDFDFEAMDLPGLHVMPSPLHVRPSALELHRLRAHLAALGDTHTVEALADRQPPAVPVGPAQWVELAKIVRRDRALADLYSGLKTYIGGDVHHTTLRVGEATTRRIHRFTDSGPEFTAMMAGSLHPIGQLAPCECGSGQTFADCCLQAIATESCPCRSGDTFADCCSLATPAPASALAS